MYFRKIERSPGAVLVPPRPATLALLKLIVLSGTRKPIDALPSRNVFSIPKSWW